MEIDTHALAHHIRFSSSETSFHWNCCCRRIFSIFFYFQLKYLIILFVFISSQSSASFFRMCLVWYKNKISKMYGQIRSIIDVMRWLHVHWCWLWWWSLRFLRVIFYLLSAVLVHHRRRRCRNSSFHISFNLIEFLVCCCCVLADCMHSVNKNRRNTDLDLD